MKVTTAVLLIAASLGPQAARAAGPPGREVEGLIDQLTEVTEVGVGYSDLSDGSEFLPLSGSRQTSTLVLGSPPPRRSRTMEGLVRAGTAAVPQLLKHLDDERKTAIPLVSGMMWMEFDNRLDSNARTRKGPALPNGDRDRPDGFPKGYQLTVGDLCFVALGQIVNRYYSASRYQPTAGLIVTSPTHSRRLCEALRREFGGLTEQSHRKLLREDFRKPDHDDRRLGAYRRLAFYYPDEVEGLILKQLEVPTYDVFAVETFVRETLYREPSAAKRKELFGQFLRVRVRGRATSDGVLLQLFGDLESQEAYETDRVTPPPEEAYNARGLLIELYGYKPGVRSGERPFVETWAAHEKAELIGALVHDDNKTIDEAVARIFRGIKDDDSLALACMIRLAGRGYAGEARTYCDRRVEFSKRDAKGLREMLDRLDSLERKPGTPADPPASSSPRP